MGLDEWDVAKPPLQPWEMSKQCREYVNKVGTVCGTRGGSNWPLNPRQTRLSWEMQVLCGSLRVAPPPAARPVFAPLHPRPVCSIHRPSIWAGIDRAWGLLDRAPRGGNEGYSRRVRRKTGSHLHKWLKCGRWGLSEGSVRWNGRWAGEVSWVKGHATGALADVVRRKRRLFA